MNDPEVTIILAPTLSSAASWNGTIITPRSLSRARGLTADRLIIERSAWDLPIGARQVMAREIEPCFAAGPRKPWIKRTLKQFTQETK